MTDMLLLPDQSRLTRAWVRQSEIQEARERAEDIIAGIFPEFDPDSDMDDHKSETIATMQRMVGPLLIPGVDTLLAWVHALPGADTLSTAWGAVEFARSMRQDAAELGIDPVMGASIANLAERIGAAAVGEAMWEGLQAYAGDHDAHDAQEFETYAEYLMDNGPDRDDWRHMSHGSDALPHGSVDPRDPDRTRESWRGPLHVYYDDIVRDFDSLGITVENAWEWFREERGNPSQASGYWCSSGITLASFGDNGSGEREEQYPVDAVMYPMTHGPYPRMACLATTRPGSTYPDMSAIDHARALLLATVKSVSKCYDITPTDIVAADDMWHDPYPYMDIILSTDIRAEVVLDVNMSCTLLEWFYSDPEEPRPTTLPWWYVAYRSTIPADPPEAMVTVASAVETVESDDPEGED